MYFASLDEQRYVQRALLPEARRQPVAEELRGWNWHQPPLKPIYSAPLGVSEVAGRYCPTGRDVFLRRVGRLAPAPSSAMVEGRLMHAVVAGLFVEAKRLVYRHGAGCLPYLERLRRRPLPEAGGGVGAEARVRADEHSGSAGPGGDERRALLGRMRAVRDFQARRIVERVEEVLARRPHLGPDALATLALPVHVEVALDGRFLGLSERLMADGIVFPHMLVFDLKFGPRQEFHRLATTGYALVLESLYEAPVELGCVVYAQVVDGRVAVERDYHLIGDELRQTFIEERDDRMRLVSEEQDPGLPEACPASCPFLPHCHPRREALPVATQRPASANPRRPRPARRVEEP